MSRTLEDLTNEGITGPRFDQDIPAFLRGLRADRAKRWQPIALPKPPPLDTRIALTFYGREAFILVGIGFLLGFCCALFFAPSLLP